MKQIQSLVFLAILSTMLLFTSCQDTKTTQEVPSDLYSLFQPINPMDTLVLSPEELSADTGSMLSATQFLHSIDSSLFRKIDTFEFECRAYWKIELDEQYEGCLLGINQSWQKFKYLLIFSKAEEKFIDLVPVAYFYGGQGGQILKKSWLFQDHDQYYLPTRQLEHYLRMPEEGQHEIVDINLQSVDLLLWSGSQFEAAMMRDTMGLIEAFPLSME